MTLNGKSVEQEEVDLATVKPTQPKTVLPLNSFRLPGRLRLSLFLCLGGCLIGSSCSHPLPQDALVVTQSPRSEGSAPADSSQDLRYPPGTRVAIVAQNARPETVRVLSEGLIAAAEPVISFDARKIVFAGKETTNGVWQIYEASALGGRPRRLTSTPAGATDPALLADGTLLFVSPVPSPVPNRSTRLSALFAQSSDGTVRRLTFANARITDPTVLPDGRILFVAAVAGGNGSGSSSALYTINNDGTEVSAFATQHDEPALIARPRQLIDGRIVFLVAHAGAAQVRRAEYVLSANPFRSRAPLLLTSGAMVSCVQPVGANGDLLVCARTKATADRTCCSSSSVFRLNAAESKLGLPIFTDSSWDTVEAITLNISQRPMGRLSTVDLTRKTGQILCLDANTTSYATAAAERVRVFAEQNPGARMTLGEVPLQSDGSFMAEVPADIPIGFEALDRDGQVVRREPALLWVRPGENRSCIGCHEIHNHSPRNVRPLAVRFPVPKLLGESVKVAEAKN